jgi:hypothetical protein
MNNYYVLHDTEHKKTSIINYEPNVPASIKVYKITEKEKQNVDAGTHFFNVSNNAVEMKPSEELQAEALAKHTQQENSKHREFLNRTDWKVLRHMREIALNQPTTLSQQEYIELERERDKSANSIKK